MATNEELEKRIETLEKEVHTTPKSCSAISNEK